MAVWRIVTAITGIRQDARQLIANGPFHVGNDGRKRVTVVRVGVAPKRPDMLRFEIAS